MFTSTTSQLLVGAVLFYGLGSLILIWRGTLTTLESLQWLINILLPIYAVRKGLTAGQNSNGGLHELAPSRPQVPEAIAPPPGA